MSANGSGESIHETLSRVLSERDRARGVIRELVRTTSLAPHSNLANAADELAAWQAARELLAGLVVPK